MWDGPSVAAALAGCGITHVVWIPDSELGTWEPDLSSHPSLHLIRVCREGEAFAVAAGLWLGGKKPIILIQCTGLFEAGDSLRNILHDLRLPLFLVIGLRSYHAHRQGTTADTCPLFAEPILAAWQIPFRVLDDTNSLSDLIDAYQEAQQDSRPGAVFFAE
jgi:sulfopyruvate decarboxylase subunit alpha